MTRFPYLSKPVWIIGIIVLLILAFLLIEGAIGGHVS